MSEFAREILSFMISFERNVCNIRSSQKSINFHHNKYFSQTCSLFRKWPFHIVGETLFSLKYKKAPIVSSLEKKTNTHVESIYNYYASLLVFVVWPRGQQLTVNPFAQKREKCSKWPLFSYQIMPTRKSMVYVVV